MKTVRDLIEQLSKLDQDAVVILSSDSEGNSYSTWSGDYCLDPFIPEERYWVGSLAISEDEYKEEFSDEYGSYGDYLNHYKAVPAVTLWPEH